MRFGSPLAANDASAAACVVAVCVDSVYVVFLIGTLRTVVATNALFGAEFGMTNQAGMVQREPIGLGRSARAASSVGGIQIAALHARSSPQPAEASMRGGCARRISLEMTC
jgi:hypothetical protein